MGVLLPFLLEMAAGAEEEGKLFKVIVCGEYACGKTSIISRYTSNTFSPNYKLTIGVDFTLKVLEHKGESVKLQLWDISGSERYGSMTRAYYKHCIAAVIVYDITREPTFEAVIKCKRDIDSKVMLANGDPVPTLLLATRPTSARSQTQTSSTGTAPKTGLSGGLLPRQGKTSESTTPLPDSQTKSSRSRQRTSRRTPPQGSSRS